MWIPHFEELLYVTVVQLSGIHHVLLFTSRFRRPNTNQMPKMFSFLRLGQCGICLLFSDTSLQSYHHSAVPHFSLN